MDPGTTTLRVLIVEAQGRQATVWGWAGIPAVSGSDPDVKSLAFACEGALSLAEEMAQDKAGRWLMADQMVVGLPTSQLQGMGAAGRAAALAARDGRSTSRS